MTPGACLSWPRSYMATLDTVPSPLSLKVVMAWTALKWLPSPRKLSTRLRQSRTGQTKGASSVGKAM